MQRRSATTMRRRTWRAESFGASLRERGLLPNSCIQMAFCCGARALLWQPRKLAANCATWTAPGGRSLGPRFTKKRNGTKKHGKDRSWPGKGVSRGRAPAREGSTTASARRASIRDRFSRRPEMLFAAIATCVLSGFKGVAATIGRREVLRITRSRFLPSRLSSPHSARPVACFDIHRGYVESF